MDLTIFSSEQQDLAIGMLAAAGAFFGFVVVIWPYLMNDRLEARTRWISGERERIRERGRNAAAGADPLSSVRRPGSLFSGMVRRLGLGDSADNGIAQMLETAGVRGRSAVVTYLGVRLLLPLVTLSLALLYTLGLDLDQTLGVKVAIIAAAGALGYFLPAIYVKNRIIKRQQGIQRAWPDALDLLLICVQSGMAIDPALKKVSEEIGSQSIDLAEELSLTTAELSFMPDRLQAYENLARRTGLECVKSVVASLKQAEKQGTSIGRSLRVLAQENRDTRLSLAEKKAASLPPKLTVPMILFFLPVLFVIILTPSVIKIADVI